MKVFVTIAAALALAACGGGGSATQEPTVTPNPQAIAAGCTAPTETGPTVKITGNNGNHQLPNTGKKYEVIVTGSNVDVTVMPCAYITVLRVEGGNGDYIFSPSAAVETILIVGGNNDLEIPTVSTAIVEDKGGNNSVTRSE